MIKMNNEEDKNNNIGEDIDNKIGHIIPLGFKKQEESLFIQKGKEYMKNKKAISMRHIFENKDKISININQNININANIKTPEKEKQTENQIKIQNEKGIKQEIINVTVGQGFNESSKPTNCCNLLQKNLEINNIKYVINLWDTIGQEAYKGISKLFFREAQIVIFVYDITSKDSFLNLEEWIQMVL